MIRAGNISVPLDFDFTRLKEFCAERFGIAFHEIKEAKLSKKSVDARKKSDVHFVINIDMEVKDEQRVLKRNKSFTAVKNNVYEIPKLEPVSVRPVIVGFGPAGMFAALVLAMAGARPIVLERGYDVDSRVKAVEQFEREGVLNPECNVQFGEGGAGTFSDGKLTTGIKDRRIGWIFRQLVKFGAPDEILYLAKPHIGTDKLRETVKNLREKVISLGGEVRFGACFCGYTAENGRISSVTYTDSEGQHTLNTGNVILASGHSARDVFELLKQNEISLSRKNFSVGVRIEHLRKDIDKAMYGRFAGHPALKAADYKLAVHLPNGRSLYTFCMCPGGVIAAASSEEERLAVNGMSYFARDKENSNSALLVNINTDDFEGDDVLAGMYFQRETEHKAYLAGGGGYKAPVSAVGDFLEGRKTEKLGRVKPSYPIGYAFAEPKEYLPDFVCETLKLGLKEMGKKIYGFDDSEAILTGIESRSSSPVRINRGEDYQSVSLSGLYPCGEGAGYAGGIVSAAADGMKCAEAVIEAIKNK